MRRTSSWAAAGAGLLLAAMVLAACSAGTAPAPAQRAPQATASAPAPAAPAVARGMDAYPTADDQEVKIRAAWCAVAGAMFPLWVAKEAGIFTRHRLDAELVFMQGGSPCQAAMMNGEVDFLESAGGLIPGLMASGAGLVIANFYLG